MQTFLLVGESELTKLQVAQVHQIVVHAKRVSHQDDRAQRIVNAVSDCT